MTGTRNPVSIVIAFIVVLCLVAGVLAKHWLVRTQGEHRFNFGPLGYQVCDDATCLSAGNLDFIADLKGLGDEQRHANEDTRFVQSAIMHSIDYEHIDEAIKGATNEFSFAGYLTLIAALHAVIGLSLAAIAAARRRRSDVAYWLARIGIVALLVALVASCAFIGKKPGGRDFVEMASAFWVFLVAVVVGIPVSQSIARQVRPDEVLGA